MSLERVLSVSLFPTDLARPRSRKFFHELIRILKSLAAASPETPPARKINQKDTIRTKEYTSESRFCSLSFIMARHRFVG